MDYELYCLLRDKCRNIPDEFEVKACQFCENYNHFKFTCPRLHYAPFEQQVVNKYVYKEKKDKNGRCRFQRNKNHKLTPIQFYSKVKGYNCNMVKDKRKPSVIAYENSPSSCMEPSSDPSLNNIRNSFVQSVEERTR